MVTRMVAVAVAAVVALDTGDALAAFCMKKSGVVAFRTTCKKKEMAIDLSQEPALRGPQGEPGEPGEQGEPGEAGAPGPFVETLPSGQTLTGAYTVTGTAAAASAYAQGSISFAFPLAAPPTAHFVEDGSEAPAECPGTASEPAAAAGHLCIYESQRTNMGVASFNDPVTGSSGTTTRTFGMLVGGRSAAAGDFWSSGSWAVTAP